MRMLLLPLLLALAGAPCSGAVTNYTERSIEGWRVLVDTNLTAAANAPLCDDAMTQLAADLLRIRMDVPTGAVARLKVRTAIWVTLESTNTRSACCYHPSAGWLRAHGEPVEKEKAVEICNVRNYLAWHREQPSEILHELAHAWHDQVVGYDNAELKALYKKAASSGTYDHVAHALPQYRPARHYGMNNDQEYFAESSEAFFGTNDLFPFVHSELKAHDPDMERFVRAAWYGPAPQ